MSASQLSRRNLVAAAEPDPIYAVIEAYCECDKLLSEFVPEFGPPLPGAEAVREAEMEATRRLCHTVPTTMAGLNTFLDFIVSEKTVIEYDAMALIVSTRESVRRMAARKGAKK
jgi:hypothetical protein